jgi:hypothetical protein
MPLRPPISSLSSILTAHIHLPHLLLVLPCSIIIEVALSTMASLDPFYPYLNLADLPNLPNLANLGAMPCFSNFLSFLFPVQSEILQYI